MRVLVTAGGTEEPIDGVRRLTNVSTGATGGAIATGLVERGAEVVLLHAARASLAGVVCERIPFVTYGELEDELRRQLGGREFDAVVHLAAVSDYAVASVEVDGRPIEHGEHGKIASGHDVVIRLRPTAKLIDRLRSWSRNPAVQVVGFKLTNDPDREARAARVRALLDRGTTDLVVHNDLAEIAGDRHPAEIWTPRGPLARTATKRELAEALYGLLDPAAEGTPSPAASDRENHR